MELNEMNYDELLEPVNSVDSTPVEEKPRQVESPYVEEEEQHTESEDEDNSGKEQISGDYISRYLREYGIEDSSKIKYENENGETEEVDFNSLDDDEKLDILKSLADPGLSEDEKSTINYLRKNKMNFSQVIDYFANKRLEEYLQEHPEDVKQPTYQIDDYSDDELYLADLKAKYPNFTDEELLAKLDSAKTNEDLFKKEVDALREDYKNQEDEYNKQVEEKEQEDYQNLQNNLMAAASNFTEVLLDPEDPESDSLQIEDSDRNQIMQYLLQKDKDGKSQFVKDIENPQVLVQLAWLRLQGQNAIADTSKYWKETLKDTRKENAKLQKELEKYKSNKMDNTITIPKQPKSEDGNKVPSIGSAWDYSDLL